MKLKIPSIAAKPDPSVELRGVYLEEWIEGLPYAEPVAMLETVLGALDRFNRCPVKASARLALLEMYLRPYEYLLEVQEGYHTISTVASVERHRRQADAARRMAMAMADGYKIILSQTLGKRGLFGTARESRTALQRASAFLSFALLHCYDEYLPTPPLVWRELTALFVYATRNDLAAKGLPGKSQRAEFRQDIDTIFKRVALTSVVDPYRLPYGEVWQVYDEFRDSAREARILAPGEARETTGCFLIDPSADRRPEPWAGAGEPAGEGALVIDANPALERLNARRAALTRGGDAHTLLGTIVQALGAPSKRSDRREPSEGRVHLVAGLGAVHHFLSGAPPGSGPRPSGSDEIELGDVGATVPEEPAGPAYKPEFWELRNEGAGGIGVLRRVRPTQAVGVGEPIGLQFPLRGESGTRWSVGVVRWLSFDDGGECQAGVQLLSPAGEAVALDHPGSPGRGLQALALPSLSEPEGTTLLTPPGVFAPDRSLAVRTGRGPVTVRCAALLESSSSFERFSVTTP